MPGGKIRKLLGKFNKVEGELGIDPRAQCPPPQGPSINKSSPPIHSRSPEALQTPSVPSLNRCVARVPTPIEIPHDTDHESQDQPKPVKSILTPKWGPPSSTSSSTPKHVSFGTVEERSFIPGELHEFLVHAPINMHSQWLITPTSPGEAYSLHTHRQGLSKQRIFELHSQSHSPRTPVVKWTAKPLTLSPRCVPSGQSLHNLIYRINPEGSDSILWSLRLHKFVSDSESGRVPLAYKGYDGSQIDIAKSRLFTAHTSDSVKLDWRGRTYSGWGRWTIHPSGEAPNDGNVLARATFQGLNDEDNFLKYVVEVAPIVKKKALPFLTVLCLCIQAAHPTIDGQAPVDAAEAWST